MVLCTLVYYLLHWYMQFFSETSVQPLPTKNHVPKSCDSSDRRREGGRSKRNSGGESVWRKQCHWATWQPWPHLCWLWRVSKGRQRRLLIEKNLGFWKLLIMPRIRFSFKPLFKSFYCEDGWHHWYFNSDREAGSYYYDGDEEFEYEDYGNSVWEFSQRFSQGRRRLKMQVIKEPG